MTKQVKVIGIANEKPDVRLYALALIALARQIQDEGEAAEAIRREHDNSYTEERSA